jgi:hypothetical protein
MSESNCKSLQGMHIIKVSLQYIHHILMAHHPSSNAEDVGGERGGGHLHPVAWLLQLSDRSGDGGSQGSVMLRLCLVKSNRTLDSYV